jgi:hypothetical protein
VTDSLKRKRENMLEALQTTTDTDVSSQRETQEIIRLWMKESIHDPIHISKIEEAIRATEREIRCQSEQLGNCGSCPIALLALAITRWAPTSSRTAEQMVAPLCHQHQSTSLGHKPNVSRLRNRDAYFGLGGGVTNRSEGWLDHE